MSATEASRRERKKHRTRQDLEAAAWRLFTDRGYDATTIADIAEQVDVAERTFFRYFESKEAVLFGDWREDLDDLTAMVRDRPRHESAWGALREAVLVVANRYEHERERNLLRAQLIVNVPTATGYQQQVMFPTLEGVLAQALADRLGVDPTLDLRPHVYAGAAIAAIRAAVLNWTSTDCVSPLAYQVISALDLIEPTSGSAIGEETEIANAYSELPPMEDQ